MACAREQRLPRVPVQNDIGHADEHVLFHVGIELPVHPPQNFGGRELAGSLTPQGTPTHRHDERGGDTLSRDIRNRDAEVVVIHGKVIKVVPTEGACGEI